MSEKVNIRDAKTQRKPVEGNFDDALPTGDVRELRGLLKQSSRRRVIVEEMNAAILREHARKP